MTIKNLITYFRQFATQHPILKTFSWGNLSDYSREDFITQYPAIHFVPQPSTLGDTSQDITFSVLVYDLLNEYVDNPTNSNQLDSMALCEEIMGDFYNYFINQLSQYGYYLQSPIQYSYFTDRFAESVCGVEGQITITIEQTACIPPYEPPVELPAQENLQFWYDATDTDTMELYQDSSGDTRVHQFRNKGIYTGGTLNTFVDYTTYEYAGMELSFDLKTNTPCLTNDYNATQIADNNQKSLLVPNVSETGFTTSSGYTIIHFIKPTKYSTAPFEFSYDFPTYNSLTMNTFGNSFTTSYRNTFVLNVNQANSNFRLPEPQLSNLSTAYDTDRGLRSIAYYDDYALYIGNVDLINNKYSSEVNGSPGDYLNIYNMSAATTTQIRGTMIGGSILFGSNYVRENWRGGNFYETCIWDRTLTPEEIQQVKTYFNEKYNKYTKYVKYDKYNVSTIKITSDNNYPDYNNDGGIVYTEKQQSSTAGEISSNFDDTENYYIYYQPNPNSSDVVFLRRWTGTYPFYTLKDYNYKRLIVKGQQGQDEEGWRPRIIVKDLSNDKVETFRCDGRVIYTDLDINKSYYIDIDTTTTDCGFTSGNTWNSYFEVEGKTDTFFSLTTTYITGGTTTLVSNTSTGFTGSFVSNDGNRLEFSINKNSPTTFTGAYELWETDSLGNELKLLSKINIPIGNFSSNYDSWFADGHKKLKVYYD